MSQAGRQLIKISWPKTNYNSKALIVRGIRLKS